MKARILPRTDTKTFMVDLAKSLRANCPVGMSEALTIAKEIYALPDGQAFEIGIEPDCSPEVFRSQLEDLRIDVVFVGD